MIHCALKQQERIEHFMEMVLELEDDKLTKADWEDLKDLMKLLQPFKKLTVLGEGRGTVYGSIGSILWEFDVLLNLLETTRAKSRPADAPFQAALDAAWTKLDKYYQETDKCPVYIIATMLDPRMKYEYFKCQWREDWLDDVKYKMQAAFNQYRSEMEEPQTTIMHTHSDSDEDQFDIYKW